MSSTKSVILWILAVILMAGFAFYQRMTGPTYPVSGTVNINSEAVKYTLPRTHGGDGNERIKIIVKDKSVQGKFTFMRYKSFDEWKTIDMERNGDTLSAEAPHQDRAGKIIYSISLVSGNNIQKVTENPVIIRFKGATPDIIVIVHVLCIFLAMCFAVRTLFEVLFKGKNVYKLSLWTMIFFAVAGLILGPIMQWFAFGVFWSGWPFGNDLTDNKTFVSIVIWVLAVWQIRKNPEAKVWVIAAALIMIAVFLIPHSVMGSEIDYTKLKH